MIQSLNGIWNYRIGKGGWSQRAVPFSALCVGHSECERVFDLEHISPVVLLRFDGITYNAHIYLNDAYLGKLLPYSEYTFDITNIVKERDNLLHVELEDINAEFGPSEGWENYGGIIRDVSVIYKNEGYIKDVFFTGKLINDYKDAEYDVQVYASLPLSYKVTLSLGGKAVDTYVASGNQARTIKGVLPWSPDSPTLYELEIELLDGEVVDTYKMRVGFREFECRGNHFALNGKDIFLKGVCRHEMCSEDGGHTVSYEKIYKDMKMIKDTGSNFVRLVHYPHNKATIDIADELGLLCCEEPGMWQADVNNAKLTGECLEVLRRVVLRDRSHPSIAFWLAFNECDFEESFLKEAVRICRENDGTRPVSGANNMSNEDTIKYYNLCGLDFYTMHPYSHTFEMAEKASQALCDKPLMFTEWGGYYVYDKPSLLTEFLMSMHRLYEKNALAGTCLWYWAEIKDYNRGGDACIDGTLKEALVNFERKPNLIFDAFCSAIKGKESCHSAPAPLPLADYTYKSTRHREIYGRALKCKQQPSYEAVLSVARKPLKTRLAKTRKKQITSGPVFEKEEFCSVSRIPYLVSENALVFEGGMSTGSLSILGMTCLNYGYPILGDYCEDIAEITIKYTDGDTQSYTVKNGADATIAYASVGSSRINPVAENARRALSFSYDKNFEEYIVNCLEIRTPIKKISQVEIRALNDRYNLMIYGILM
ncbi:MAG: hypothetical protein IJ309_06570 [Clostridia bacterium]|nr:hypothetical protein [Clostridia bacterium]